MKPPTTQPLKCDLHDYIEIACLYRYALNLTCKDATVINAIAMDTKTSDKREYIVVKDAQIESGDRKRANQYWTNNNRSLIDIPLDSLDSIEAIGPNTMFGIIHF